MGALGIVLIIVGVVIFSIIVWYVSTMNGIRRLSLKCDEASSGIDIALTKRYDVLTKQLEVVEFFMKLSDFVQECLFRKSSRLLK